MTSPTSARNAESQEPPERRDGPQDRHGHDDGTDTDHTGQAADPADASDGGAAAVAVAGRTRASSGSRRALAAALLCGALGAALVLIAAGQQWSSAEASVANSTLPVTAKGSEVTGLPSALALVGLAALVAVFAVRRAARLVVAALLTLTGVGTLLAALLGADASGPLDEKAAKASGLAQSGIDAVELTGWPYASAAGGALLLCAGVLALWYGRGWPSMSGTSRYERATQAPAVVDPDRPEDLWKALDRGDDPTGDAELSQPTTPAGSAGSDAAVQDGGAAGAGGADTHGAAATAGSPDGVQESPPRSADVDGPGGAERGAR